MAGAGVMEKNRIELGKSYTPETETTMTTIEENRGMRFAEVRSGSHARAEVCLQASTA
jgi:hypothetical protein